VVVVVVAALDVNKTRLPVVTVVLAAAVLVPMVRMLQHLVVLLEVDKVETLALFRVLQDLQGLDVLVS
jgi:hypothetical protein